MTRNGWHAATTDETQIRAWWTKTPDANIAIACGPSGLAVLDIDHGLANVEEAQRFLSSISAEPTYMVRTGRRPEFGLQVYFAGALPDVGLWRLNGCEGQVKSLGGYVMAAGSIHPSGEEYVPLNGAEPLLAPTPDAIYGLKRAEREVLSVQDGRKIPEGAGRHHALASIAGGLRAKGLGGEAIYEALIPINPAMCEVPLSDDDLRELAHGIARRYRPNEPEPIAVIGGGRGGRGGRKVEVVRDEDDADELVEGGRPVYPDDIWDGTAYGEFADMCAAGSYIPKKMFSESLRTVVGAIVGDRLSSPVDGCCPRAYTIKIAPPGSGKGTSDARVRTLFEDRWDGLMRTEGSLLFGKDDFLWRGRGLGAQVVNPASAPGLIKSIEDRPARKGETANPLEGWKPMPRVITMAEEVRGLFANFANESTGAGLESVLCELYDRDNFTSTATKDREAASGKLMYSLLGGITKEAWDGVFSKTESIGSGFLSRVNIIGTEETRTTAGLRVPDFTAFRNRFFPLIEALEKTPRNIDASPEALAAMERWFSRLVLPEGVSKARLNTHAWRTGLHLAWLTGSAYMEPEHVEAGMKAAEYQAKMREHYAPPEGETRGARCEAAIRKAVRSRRRITVRELRKLTNSHRFGIGIWDAALASLVKVREVRMEEGARGSKTVILLKTNG